MENVSGASRNANSTDETVTNAATGTVRLAYIYLGILFCAIEAIIFLPIIFGNLLILLSIARFKRLRTRINVLIANLAVSDLLVGIVMIPYDLNFMFNTSLRQNKLTCLLRHTFEIAFIGSSVLNLLVISIERYLAIVHPLFHVKKSTKNWLATLIASSWVISILVACLPLFGWNSWYPGVPCDPMYIYSKSYSGLVYCILIGSMIANFVMYVQVVNTALAQLRALQAETSVVADDALRHVHIKKKSIKKTKMMILVLGVFAICWGPYCLTILFETIFLEPSDSMELVEKFLACFGILNSGLNWIIFGLKNSSYRKAFKYLLCCGKGISDSSLIISSTGK